MGLVAPPTNPLVDARVPDRAGLVLVDDGVPRRVVGKVAAATGVLPLGLGEVVDLLQPTEVESADWSAASGVVEESVPLGKRDYHQS